MNGAQSLFKALTDAGLDTCFANLHNAGRANTPVVNIVGANASYHQPNFPEHELIGDKITELARAVSHWTREAKSAGEMGPLGAHALRSEGLELAGRIAASTGAQLLAETFPARLARGEGQVQVTLVPYFLEMARQFFAEYLQIILVGALPPVST